MKRAGLSVIALIIFAGWVAADPIDNLAASLRATPLWGNGNELILDLPADTPIPQVAEKAIALSDMSRELTASKIVEIRQIHDMTYKGDDYVAVLVSNQSYRAVVLLRHHEGFGWSHYVYQIGTKGEPADRQVPLSIRRSLTSAKSTGVPKYNLGPRKANPCSSHKNSVILSGGEREVCFPGT